MKPRFNFLSLKHVGIKGEQSDGEEEEYVSDQRRADTADERLVIEQFKDATDEELESLFDSSIYEVRRIYENRYGQHSIHHMFKFKGRWTSFFDLLSESVDTAGMFLFTISPNEIAQIWFGRVLSNDQEIRDFAEELGVFVDSITRRMRSYLNKPLTSFSIYSNKPVNMLTLDIIRTHALNPNSASEYHRTTMTVCLFASDDIIQRLFQNVYDYAQRKEGCGVFLRKGMVDAANAMLMRSFPGVGISAYERLSDEFSRDHPPTWSQSFFVTTTTTIVAPLLFIEEDSLNIYVSNLTVFYDNPDVYNKYKIGNN